MHNQLFPQAVLRLILEESAERHKHLCPRQALGARIGLRGLRALGLIGEGYDDRYVNGRKHLLTIAETDGCGLDGIAVASDCHVGRRTLRVLDYGKVAATFVNVRSGEAVRVAPQATIRETALIYAPNARSRWHAYLEAYQIIPDHELLRVEQVKLTQSLEEILSKPRMRATCELCKEEIINEREVEVNGRVLCQSCAGNSYYTNL